MSQNDLSPLLDSVVGEPPEPEYPHWLTVPLTPKENVLFRKDIRTRAANSKTYREDLIAKCREDSLYWLSSFCFLYEPRPRPRILPFIPWTHQVPVWKTTERYLGYKDIGWEKSRGEGASWMACMLILHKWLYLDMFAAGVVSKDEETAVSAENPDSLFWKILWQLKHLPDWMLPRFTHKARNNTITNHDNGSTIAGFAATPNVGTGGRKVVFVMDELAKFPRGGRPPADKACMDSTQHVTDCRLLISTPYGPSGAYYDAMHGDSNLVKLRLHWSDNPRRRVGGYRVHIGGDGRRRVELVDLDFWLQMAQRKRPQSTKADLPLLAREIREHLNADNPFGYEFMISGEYVKDGELRSPWYDNECRRPGATPKGIAQELDLDYGGSASRFFSIQLLEELQRTTCCKPKYRGEIVYERSADHWMQLKEARFVPNETGRLLLWFDPFTLAGDKAHRARPPANRNYVIGGDIAAGSGGIASSNSSLTVLDRDTGQQVAEFTAPDVPPSELADLAVALCYWFTGKHGPAMLIWEANGPPGSQFTKRIIDLQYANCYTRAKNPEQMNSSPSKMLGFISGVKTKPALLGEFSRALDSGQCEIRSHQTIEECKFYMHFPGGRINHVAANSEDDPTGAGESHGDRVIGAALAWWLAREYRIVRPEETKEVPVGSFAWRQRQAQLERRKRENQPWIPRSKRRRLGLGRQGGIFVP